MTDTKAAPITIRRARPSDLEAVGRVIVDAYVADGFLAADDDYARVLADSADRDAKAELWVATVGAQVVGSVTFCPPGSDYRELARDGQGEFRMLGVSPGARGQGIARALVALCFDRCRELQLTEMVICSMDEMTSAHALYATLGFVRDQTLDWRPIPEVLLLGFRAQVPSAHSG